jgi:hypothetical protein
MKKLLAVLSAGFFAVSSTKAGQEVSGIDFVVSHATTISAIGVYDGGSSLTSKETVGIFNDLTGNLVGSEAVFGPGKSGTQVGDTFYESVPDFTLAPGDYSIIYVGGNSSGGGNHLSGGDFADLGGDINLPGGSRFNSGTDFIISLSENGNSTSPESPLALIDPVPDGGMTMMLLGATFSGIGLVRRKIRA